MQFTLTDQTLYFIYSIVFGAILSSLYDFLRVLRISGFNKQYQIITSDIIYFVLCAFLTVLFALPFNKGEVRYFVLIGESLGFITYRFTIGELSVRVYVRILHIITFFLKKSSKYLLLFSNKVLKANRFVVYNVVVIIHSIQNVVFRKKKDNQYEQKERY